MRVAVDCRFLSLSPALMTRGIPRYTQQQIRAVLRLDRTNEYVLLHRAHDDVSHLLAEIREAPNVTLRALPGEAKHLAEPERTLRATEAFERLLIQERIDLFHATVPWLPVVNVFPAIDACPVITTVYDLIPSLFTEHLVGEMKTGWALASEQFRRATRLLAISAHTARDLSLHFGISPDRIDLAYPFAESFCQPLAADEVDRRLARLRQRIGLPDRFVMTVSFVGFRNKNLETLLDGYRHLPHALRRVMPLVVVGIQGPSAERLKEICRHYRIESDVITTGVISDEELAALYNKALMLVCPSRYEGFGLPLAEAMQCGTPVVTTTQSCMPEVAGDAGWLVDAEDARAFAHAIETLAGDDARRAAMSRAGLEQAKRFTSEGLGRATLAAYQRAAASPRGALDVAPVRPAGASARGAGAPRVALCLRNPQPPTEETRAALELAEAIDAEASVDLFAIGDGLPACDLLRRYRVRDIGALDRLQAAQPYDAVLRLWDAETAKLAPSLASTDTGIGIVTGSLSDDVAQLLAGPATPSSSSPSASSAAAPASAAPSSAATPAAAQVPTAARRMIVVATEAMRARLADRPGVDVRVALPGVADPLGSQPQLQREQARAQLGLSTTSFVVSWPDPSGSASDAQVVLLAFADLCQMCPQAWLLVGRSNPANHALPTAVAAFATSLGVLPRLRAQAGSDQVSADAYLVAADVVIAIDAPERVAAPQSVLRACAAGKPIAVSDSAAWRWTPDDACWRVPDGPTAGLVLGEALRTLSHDGPRREAMGRAARAAYEREFTLAHMAARYRQAIGPQPVDAASTPAASNDVIREATIPAATTPATASGAISRATAAQSPDIVSSAPPPVAASARSFEPTNDGAPRLGFNRVCNIEDFQDPELVAEMREVMAYKHAHFGDTFPQGVEHCKDWEVAMATRTLRHFGALRPDASILGVAAGMEDTIFYLTRHVREVMSVDRYAQSGVWQLNAPMWMLVTPEWGAHGTCVPERLVVQHMDARRLRFPDDRFDGIFSSGSIEHFGGLMDVAHAAYEMGRVLKPGGILSLATVMSIAGPPDRMGTPGTCLMFQRHHMERYIVEASGLELVDSFVTDATPATHAVHRSLEAVLIEAGGRSAAHGLKGQQEDFKHAVFPCIALDWDGVTFDSVHLALRKPLGRTQVSNAWARPTPAVEAAIVQDYRRLIEDYDAWMPPAGTAGPTVDRADIASQIRQRGAARMLRQIGSNLASDLDGLTSEVVRLGTKPDQPVPTDAAVTETAPAPAAADAHEQADRVPEPHADDPTQPSSTWVPVHVNLPSVGPYTMFVDRSERRDIVANAFLSGYGQMINVVDFELIRAFTRPGDAVIDAGAHLGSITLPLAAAGCRVLAVEASARNAALLRASVAHNGFRDVRVVCAAAAAEEGSISFLSDGAWGWVAAPGEPFSSYVPAVRLDDLVDLLGWDRIAAIKIDVEGSELAAIQGLSRILSRPDGPAVYYESNTHTLAHAGMVSGQVVAALEAFGYRNYVAKPGRLTRVHPDDVQGEVVLDHLAVKGPLPKLRHYSIDEGKRRR